MNPDLATVNDLPVARTICAKVHSKIFFDFIVAHANNPVCLSYSAGFDFFEPS
jgi:hypothetical protein